MPLGQQAKALIELNHRTAKLLDDFRAELKKTKRWTAEHQTAFRAWRHHLADSEKHLRAVAADRRVPKSAWDLAVAEARRERAHWTKALATARKDLRKIGPGIFDESEL